MVYSSKFQVKTKGFCDVIDVTDRVQNSVNDSEISNGIVTIFIVGSTAAITTIEMNANLEKDLKDALEIIAPKNKKYHHDEKWGDGNGFSHIRASLIGPSVSVPVSDGQLILGTWQQIVVCDFDNNSRDREVAVQIVGE